MYIIGIWKLKPDLPLVMTTIVANLFQLLFACNHLCYYQIAMYILPGISIHVFLSRKGVSERIKSFTSAPSV